MRRLTDYRFQFSTLSPQRNWNNSTLRLVTQRVFSEQKQPFASFTHFYNCFTCIESHGAYWSLSQLSKGEDRVSPWTRCQFIAGPHSKTKNHSHSLSVLLQVYNVQCRILGFGRDKKNTHSSALSLGFKPVTFTQ